MSEQEGKEVCILDNEIDVEIMNIDLDKLRIHQDIVIIQHKIRIIAALPIFNYKKSYTSP